MAIWDPENHKNGVARNIQTYDFSTLYTKLDHGDIKKALTFVINLAFNRNKSKPFISVYSKSSNFVKKPRSSTISFDNKSLIDSVCFLVDNSYFCFGNLCFRQIVGVPIGVDPGPYIANFTLWFYEFNFISTLYKKDYRRALKLRNTFRLIDDISSLNSDGVFHDLVSEIYPSSLVLNKENDDDTEADILDLSITIKNGKFICNVYDKRDKFKFSVVRLTPRFSNQSDNIGYCTFASQVVRFARICNNIDGISVRILFLYDLFIKLGFDSGKLIRNFRNCISHHKFDKKFNNIGQILPTISN